VCCIPDRTLTWDCITKEAVRGKTASLPSANVLLNYFPEIASREARILGQLERGEIVIKNVIGQFCRASCFSSCHEEMTLKMVTREAGQLWTDNDQQLDTSQPISTHSNADCPSHCLFCTLRITRKAWRIFLKTAQKIS